MLYLKNAITLYMYFKYEVKTMNSKKEIEQRIAELKMDYIRIQNDIEKLESVGHATASAEKRLMAIEKELSELRKQL